MKIGAYEEIHDHYVRQGVAMLDSFRPGWRDSVKVGQLDMGDAKWCVLGQIYAAEHKIAYNAYQDAMAAWRRDGFKGAAPTGPGHEPFFYGRNLLIVATGGELTEDYDARDQWAADHGFLAIWAPVDITAWSDDPEHTTMPLGTNELHDAWQRALAG